jgi:hypothetical protein
MVDRLSMKTKRNLRNLLFSQKVTKKSWITISDLTLVIEDKSLEVPAAIQSKIMSSKEIILVIQLKAKDETLSTLVK